MKSAPNLLRASAREAFAVESSLGRAVGYLDDAAMGPRGISAAEAKGIWFESPAWSGETGIVAEAHNAANARRLAEDLRLQSAESPFTLDGRLKPGVVNESRVIFKPGELNKPLIPNGYGKYTTQTFQSPLGGFQVHFYKNELTWHVIYDLNYKTVLNSKAGR